MRYSCDKMLYLQHQRKNQSPPLKGIRAKNSNDQPGNVSATGFSPTDVQTSLLMRNDSRVYINIHEAASP